jgi:hypothetical protein
MSRWNEPAIRQRAQYLRTGGDKGVRRAVAEAKRYEAEDRDEGTLPERRRSARFAAEVAR